MFEIKKVINDQMAKDCDNLLTKSVQYERKFDNNIKEDFVVSNNYVNIYKKENNILFIVYDNDKPVGFIYGYIKSATSNLFYKTVAQIDALYVLDSYRKKGIATSLINKFYEWCKDSNVKIVEISVFKDNIGAYNLYKRLGNDIEMYKMKKEL